VDGATGGEINMIYNIIITDTSKETVSALLQSYLEDSKGTQEPEEKRVDALRLLNILNNL
jgi:hypothetical protein